MYKLKFAVLLFFLPAVAQADLADIIGNYCEDVLANVAQTDTALVNAGIDLAECNVELDQCLLGTGGGLFDDPSACIRDYTRCSRVGKSDQKQACASFLNEWTRDTASATRSAKRQDVEAGWLSWFHGDSESRNDCINPAQTTAELCSDQLLGEEVPE
jgi:hypothetical protein